ncbi:MAG: lyase family protein [Bacteroidota bacterium]
MRKEKDFIGELELPAEALYGIHAVRARENFPDQSLFHKEWFQAIGIVKLACYQTFVKFEKALKDRPADATMPALRMIPGEISDSLIQAATELSNGLHFEQFIVPAMQGSAGTSINMNVNEILANRALQLLGDQPGNYSRVDPIEDANIFQSTNDVIPTALKLAAIRLLVDLESSINTVRRKVEAVENATRNDLRIAYTQMQEAVPSSYGRLFSTYNDALSRDWWRVSKCFERIKVVNLGGSAIGTGIGVPRFFVMEVVRELQSLSGLPITRAENLQDATANLDSLVEVHGILKAHAVNLEKIASDLRLLASDLNGHPEIVLPKKQLGSSIMPGKVNPVISEFVISAAHRVYANDILICSLCGQGALDLNAYLPAIGHALLESLKLLIACNKTMGQNIFDGLQVNADVAAQRLMSSPAICTALSPFVGYNKAAEVARHMKLKQCNIIKACAELEILSPKKLQDILRPENLLKTGFSLNDLIE